MMIIMTYDYINELDIMCNFLCLLTVFHRYFLLSFNVDKIFSLQTSECNLSLDEQQQF